MVDMVNRNWKKKAKREVTQQSTKKTVLAAFKVHVTRIMYVRAKGQTTVMVDIKQK